MKKQKYENTGNSSPRPKKSQMLPYRTSVEVLYPSAYRRTRSGAIRKIVAPK